MNSYSPGAIQNWLPRRLVNNSSKALCEWFYVGKKRFTEPFFDDTISVCRNLNENRKPYKVVTDLLLMEEWADNMDIIKPTAIIFHVSRCGSTLLSQMLALDEANIVLSEVPFFDELLRLPFKKQFPDNIATNNFLGAAIKCYSRKRTGKENHLFIKTDSWHLHFYPRLRTLFPFVPFILLFRNPAEIILSQQRQRGMHSVPGIIEPEVFGFSRDRVNETNLDSYMTNVLAGYFSKMIEIAKTDPHVLTLNYGEGMENILKKITAIPGLGISVEKQKLLNERSRFHAKHPQLLFEEKNKLSETPGYLLPVFQSYLQLDRLRFLTDYSRFPFYQPAF